MGTCGLRAEFSLSATYGAAKLGSVVVYTSRSSKYEVINILGVLWKSCKWINVLSVEYCTFELSFKDEAMFTLFCCGKEFSGFHSCFITRIGSQQHEFCGVSIQKS